MSDNPNRQGTDHTGRGAEPEDGPSPKRHRTSEAPDPVPGGSAQPEEHPRASQGTALRLTPQHPSGEAASTPGGYEAPPGGGASSSGASGDALLPAQRGQVAEARGKQTGIEAAGASGGSGGSGGSDAFREAPTPAPAPAPAPAPRRFSAADSGPPARHTHSNSKCVAGVQVAFPPGVKPHAPQLALMGKVLRALQNGEHALLESPTGTGKSLALLCATMAWQEQEKQALQAPRDHPPTAFDRPQASSSASAAPPAMHHPTSHLPASSSGLDASAPAAGLPANLPCAPAAGGGALRGVSAVRPAGPASVPVPPAPFEGEAGEAGRGAREPGEASAGAGPGGVGDAIAAVFDDIRDLLEGEDASQLPPQPGSGGRDRARSGGPRPGHPASAAAPPPPPPPPPAPPRIFLCSRTHSQLQQLLTEAKRAPYRPRMTLLGSRRELCGNEEVRRSGNENVECRAHVKARTCALHGRFPEVSRELKQLGVWDMEDMRLLEERHRGCRFYATRELLAEGAEVVLCPYNYIFDPRVRQAMSINVRGAAIIIDEGHNIEEVCREAASCEVRSRARRQAVAELQQIAQYHLQRTGMLVALMEQWSAFVDAELAELEQETAARTRRLPYGEEPHRIYPGSRALALLQEKVCLRETAGAAAGTVAVGFKELVIGAARQAAEIEELLEEQRRVGWGADSIALAGKVIGALWGLLEEAGNADDFRMYVQGPSQWGDDTDSQWAIWCLNPARVFQGVAREARCVVITSGTLAPMGSFAGELGCEFVHRLEAPHIVPRDQVHVRALPDLGECTFAVTSQPQWGPRLGRLLADLCSVIPHGVLVFFPSYTLLNKAVEAWQAGDTWQVLSARKHVVVEPRRGGGAAFAATMQEYYQHVHQGPGALMLAVCRGKVSEGLNFKYENARAVFVIGIPYPPVKDVKVKAKKEYNEQRRRHQERSGAVPEALKVLPGGAWYRQQAFRAYNQALGRVIRDQADYGAIFLLDARFALGFGQDYAAHRSALSVWVRSRIIDDRAAGAGLREQLQGFYGGLGKDPRMGRLRGPHLDASVDVAMTQPDLEFD